MTEPVWINVPVLESIQMLFPPGLTCAVTRPPLPRVNTRSYILSIAVLCFMGCMMGCGTLPHGRGWGQDAFARVNSQTIVRAAQDALFDVETLFPAAAALIFAAGGLDQQVSDWAREHTPIFSGQETARDVSDYLRGALLAEALVTTMATPSGNHGKEWLTAKGKGLGVALLAVGVTEGTTEVLKRLAKRTRPDGSSDRSFPSRHASSAFTAMTLSNRNLESLPLAPKVQYSLKITNVGLASGTAWARVEGGKHFPSDVLAGAALGRFFSAVIHDALSGLPEVQRFELIIWPSKEGTLVRLSFPFD